MDKKKYSPRDRGLIFFGNVFLTCHSPFKSVSDDSSWPYRFKLDRGAYVTKIFGHAMLIAILVLTVLMMWKC